MSTRHSNSLFPIVTLLGLTALHAASAWAQDTEVPATEPEAAPTPYFTNVSSANGLDGVRAKTCAFADLDGDGRWDVIVDRRHIHLQQEDGTFALHAESGLPFPTIQYVPLGGDGKPDAAKTKEREYVPHSLYFADLDNDGDTDAVWGVKAHWEWFDGASWKTVKECDHGLRTTVFLNDGKAQFKAAKASDLSAPEAGGAHMALALVDTDRDGILDLYEGREYRRYGMLYGCGVDRLWKGDGKGGFTDVTEKSGLMTVPAPATDRSSRPSYGVTHADVNGDGLQDLLEMAYGRQWNYLWLGKPDGTFEEAGLSTGFAGDDITHGKYPEWVKESFRKRGQERRDEDPFRSNGNTFDCAVADYDNDGDLDLFLGEIKHRWAGESSDFPALLTNRLKEEGKLRFDRSPVTEFLPKRTFRGENWNYGDLHAAWLDFDNDMLPDLLIGSGDYPDGQYLRLYRQLPDHTFEEATPEAGFDWEGCGGISVGDYDRDGDVDILAGRSFMRLNKAHREKYMGGIAVNQVALFRNDVGNRNHWLNVRLAGGGKGKANRAGIGARIEVTAGGVTQTREIRCGAGLGNHQDPPEACFGLAGNESVERLVIRWPDAKGTVQTFENVAADRFVVVTQGKKKLALSER